jgi:2-hydroxy-3-oxopropionate reductase
VALPVTGLVAQLIAAARAQGYGSLDHSAVLKVVETLSGPAQSGAAAVRGSTAGVA